MKQTIIYIRTSTEEQTPELQLNDCEALTNKLSLNDCQVISEQQSAFRDIARDKFESIREAIKKQEVKTLICWDLDRLYRNRQKLIEFFEFCKIYHCKIYSARQDWLESLNKMPEPFNEIMFNFMLSIMGWLAEEESSKKSMRVKNAVRKETGITKSYKGNKWGRKKKKVDVDLILELHKQNLSSYEIAKKYNEDKPAKLRISHMTVYTILKNMGI